jgi:hypothetical protein
MDITERIQQANENFIKQREAYYQKMRLIAEDYTKEVIVPFCDRYKLTFAMVSLRGDGSEVKDFYGQKDATVEGPRYDLSEQRFVPQYFTNYSEEFREELANVRKVIDLELPDMVDGCFGGSSKMFNEFCPEYRSPTSMTYEEK